MALYKFLTSVEEAIIYFREGDDEHGHSKLAKVKKMYYELNENDQETVKRIFGNNGVLHEILNDSKEIVDHPNLDDFGNVLMPATSRDYVSLE